MELIKEDIPVKIFIHHILRAKQDEEEPNYFHFKNRGIRAVDIMGVVTEVRKIGDYHSYRVDDGTGEILCNFNHNNNRIMNEIAEIEHLQEDIAERNYDKGISEEGAAMEHLLEVAYSKHQKLLRPLEQGECAHVQGFIKMFHDKREITVFRINKVSSFADQFDRIFEMSTLYSKCYTKKDEPKDESILLQRDLRNESLEGTEDTPINVSDGSADEAGTI